MADPIPPDHLIDQIRPVRLIPVTRIEFPITHYHLPGNAIFCCFGCMSSVGALTGVAMLEAFRKLDKEKNGLFCTSAIAAQVPKHRKTTEQAATITVIDGCANKCATKILEKDGFKVTKSLNLVRDLKIPKTGPFKPFDYSQEDMEKTVEAIVTLCEEG